MKSPVAYYLMLLYITVMFKPLAPIVSDAFSHTFNEMSHIATVHAKYGNNHLAVELGDTGKDDNSKNQNTINSVNEVPLHLPIDKAVDRLASIKISNSYFFYTLCYFPVVYVSNQGPPPKFS